MCSWASDADRDQVLDAIRGGKPVLAGVRLAHVTSASFAAALVESLRGDIARQQAGQQLTLEGDA